LGKSPSDQPAATKRAMGEHFTTHQYTKAKLPRLAFAPIKRAILGPRYSLSLVVVGDVRSRALNKKYRGKTYIPNVLSFPLSRTEGEIFLNPKKAAREAHNFGMTKRVYLAYLFIHACLHLKGLRHGATMDTIERRMLRRFKLTHTS
jgi:rRNA maturation RNase YbeY